MQRPASAERRISAGSERARGGDCPTSLTKSQPKSPIPAVSVPEPVNDRADEECWRASKRSAAQPDALHAASPRGQPEALRFRRRYRAESQSGRRAL